MTPYVFSSDYYEGLTDIIFISETDGTQLGIVRCNRLLVGLNLVTNQSKSTAVIEPHSTDVLITSHVEIVPSTVPTYQPSRQAVPCASPCEIVHIG
jgi:hypothetical protein